MFKQSVVLSDNFEYILPNYPHYVTQWVEMPWTTLYGRETIHGMRIIAVSTPVRHQHLTITCPPGKRHNTMKVKTVVPSKVIPIPEAGLVL